MRRFSLGFMMVALPTFALSLMLAGCGNKDTGSSASGTGSGSGSDKGAQTKEVKVLEPGNGVLKGKITLKGNPKIDDLTKQLHEAMKAKDTDYCMKGSETETTEQAYRVSDKGLLGNVFVWIIPEKGTFFKVTDKQLEEAKKQEVKIRQPHCAFIPHCLFLFAEYHPDPKKPRDRKSTGQELVLVNDAQIGHNTNWGNDNVIIQPGKTRVVKDLRSSASEVPIKCNIHPWMKGYLRAVDTPYYAISHSDTLDGKDKVEKTDPKFGTYEIKGLPAAKVRVIAWHEECGYLTKGGGSGEDIDIKADGPTEKDFEATAK